jgi:outer membrane biosynthesis protein TonB
MKNRTLILAAIGLMLASLAAAQSLGDLARQERAKRAKEAKKPVRVLTNEDFPAPPPAEEAIPAESAAPEPGKQPAEQAGAEPTEQVAAPSQETSAAPERPRPEDKQKTRQYWQGRFRAAKQRVADAEELERLTEDELSLLQIQQARELSPDAKADLDAQVNAKNSELETRRATTAKARKALEDLEKQFKDSGAPDDWSKTD